MDLCSPSRPQLALLNTADKATATQRNFYRELDAPLEEFECASGEIPTHFDYDGFVITGSWASVYWDREWIRALKTWVKGAVKIGLPGLGVCFGHQLLAEIEGGTVESMPAYEIGYRPVHHDGASTLLAGIPDPITVFTTHSDRVVSPPPGAHVFAENDYGIQGFRKDRLFGVQFHPEYDMDMAEQITRGKDSLSDARRQEVLNGIHQGNYKAACKAKMLFDNFLQYVEAIQSTHVAVHNRDVNAFSPI